MFYQLANNSKGYVNMILSYSNQDASSSSYYYYYFYFQNL